MVSLVLVLAAYSSVADVDPVVVAASLFKNGYAFTVREVKVGAGHTSIVSIPQYSLGTFWVGASGSAKLESLVSTERAVDSPGEVGDIHQVLRNNIGATVRLTDHQGDVFEGKILSVLTDSIVLDGNRTATLPNGNTTSENNRKFLIRRDNIRTISFDAPPNLKVPGVRRERVLRFESSGAGSFFLFGLERGLTWSPAYLLDITDKKTLTLTARATILNDLAKLDKIELRFVTGFPNVPFAPYAEPITSPLSVDQFTGMLSSLGQTADRFARRESIMTQNASFDAGGAGGPGGWPAPDPNAMEQVEDLFFYKRDGVSLEKGDRSLTMLFSARADYEHLYTLEIPETLVDANDYYRPQPEGADRYTVWHTLKFKNTAGLPLTTAPITVMSDRQILGQDTMGYTSSGAEANVKMSKALDISTEVADVEIARERNKETIYSTRYDEVTVKTTIDLTNRKKEAVRAKITKTFAGDYSVSTPPGKNTKIAKGLRRANGNNVLVWELDIPPGKKTSLTVTYKVLVRV